MFGFNQRELKILKRLNSPRKIQDFLNKLKINFEKKRETCLSPRMVLKKRRAYCIEGALLAAAALRLHGHKPLVVDLTANDRDEDHVITVFKQHGHWGAISKTNHAVLRYREPVYKTIRELVMSYFHEYFDDKGRKNLRSFTKPIDLSRFDKKNWMTSEEDVWYIPEYLADVPHQKIMSRAQIATLRKADKTELKAGDVVQFQKNKKKKQITNEQKNALS
ncbi:MAG: hypothetical protein KAT77_02935 [Nanoarchaeota archaeon]|nr:hypothetical protein [Nanoarchaeota archaeon]